MNWASSTLDQFRIVEPRSPLLAIACFTCFIRLRSGIANSSKINFPGPQPPTSTQLSCNYGNHMVDRLSPRQWQHRGRRGKYRHQAENQSAGGCNPPANRRPSQILWSCHPTAFRVRERLIKRFLSSIAGPRAYPAFVGIQSDIRAMVFRYLVVLGSYRPKRADTGADTAP
jgi:hypothetical protein